MAVGLKIPELVLPIDGIRLSTHCAGFYDEQRSDLALIEVSKGSAVSAVFTKNLFCAAPVQIAKQHLASSTPLYCLINAGNANAGTGEQGIDDAHHTCLVLANLVNCKPVEILPFSTGVIGEKLDVARIEGVLPALVDKLSGENWLNAAKAIMTTDTIPKLVSEELKIGDSKINITGMTKGAGMIKPNMATMLCFIATDANIDKKILDDLLFYAVNKSFNRITVDGDTSTNDACVLIATGNASNPVIESESSEIYERFKGKLVDVFCKLAQSIIRDGEGATKFIEIEVNEGSSKEDCLSVAYQIAESPLVKTAFTASDPNWGRILAAVGNADTKHVEIDKVNIYLDNLCIVKNGQRFEGYEEDAGKKVMLQEEIKITVNLGIGVEKERIWTTDLSHEYVTINAEYRT